MGGDGNRAASSASGGHGRSTIGGGDGAAHGAGQGSEGDETGLPAE